MENTEYWKGVELGLHAEVNNEDLTPHILGLASNSYLIVKTCPPSFW